MEFLDSTLHGGSGDGSPQNLAVFYVTKIDFVM